MFNILYTLWNFQKTLKQLKDRSVIWSIKTYHLYF